MYNTNNNILYIKTLNYYKNNNIITKIIIISLTWICWIIRKIIIFITQIIKLRNPRILITQIIIFFILITRIIIKNNNIYNTTQDPRTLGPDAGPKSIGFWHRRPRPGKPSVRWLQLGAWPAQRPGLTAKRQVSATLVGVPPAWSLGPAGCLTGLRTPAPGAAARRASLPPATKAGQTKRRVSATPMGVPPAWHLDPAGCSFIMSPPNSVVYNKNTRSL